MRSKIVAGNWKMNTTLNEGVALVNQVIEGLADVNLGPNKVVFGAPFVSLSEVSKVAHGVKGVYISAQNMSEQEAGAYTGDISAEMLNAIDVHMAIIGHSERREYHGETNALLAQKVSRAVVNNITAIYCCGEVLEERKNNSFKAVITQQITEGLFHLTAQQMAHVVIAYEPVWAIGTGETATPEQAQEAHAIIRNLLTQKYGEEVANSTSILYGGSMKPANAAELMNQPDIDGGLVGGASLKADMFLDIIKAM
jgi:triosephosphate isomerase